MTEVRDEPGRAATATARRSKRNREVRPRVLVVDCERALAGVLRCSLEAEGFLASEAYDFDDALLQVRQSNADAVVLDASLLPHGKLESSNIIEEMSKARQLAVIVMVPDDEQAKWISRNRPVICQFLDKPFAISELTALLRTTLGRIGSQVLNYSDVSLDLRTCRAVRRGKIVSLGPTTSRLLHFFLQHPGQVFSRDDLLAAIWGRQTDVKPRIVDAYIGRLRRSMAIMGAPKVIRTVRSGGYALGLEKSANSPPVEQAISSTILTPIAD